MAVGGKPARLRRVLRWRDAGGDPDLDETLYYCNDANMNVTALVDGTSGSETFGQVVERYLYDPYGKVTITDANWSVITWANSKKNEILYCGYRFDPETGLYHVRHRYYHPTLGRWISRDIDYRDGPNVYLYVSAGPIGKVDPDGRDLWDLIQGLFAPSRDCGVDYVRVSTTYKGLQVISCGHSWLETPRGNYGWAGGTEIHDVGWGGKSPDIRRDTVTRKLGTLQFGPGRGKACCLATCEEVLDCIEPAARDFAQPGRPLEFLKGLSLAGMWAALTNDPEPCGGTSCITFAMDVLEKCCLKFK